MPVFFDDTDHGHDVDTESTVTPPEQDPDIPVEYEDAGVADGEYGREKATEQHELDDLDPDYRESEGDDH